MTQQVEAVMMKCQKGKGKFPVHEKNRQKKQRANPPQGKTKEVFLQKGGKREQAACGPEKGGVN